MGARASRKVGPRGGVDGLSASRLWHPMDTLRDKNHWKNFGMEIIRLGRCGSESKILAGEASLRHGHTGFKGSWLSLWLQEMKAHVKGLALEPPTNPALFEEAAVGMGMDSEIGDIRHLDVITSSMTAFDPEILIHMAAQPLVRESYQNPIETYATNVMGTVHVLEAARDCPNLKAIVNVTSDKCYDNRQGSGGYVESDPMGGDDPYSSSKGCAELLTSSWRNPSLEIRRGLCWHRPGRGMWLVVGIGPRRGWSGYLRAFEKNLPVIIRNSRATRPWQHVLEPLSGYLVLAQNLYERGECFARGWNFGPEEEGVTTVERVVERMVSIWGEGACWEFDEKDNPPEASDLALD